MATTNHVRKSNIATAGSTTPFNYIWTLTRAMKKAGWKYKASSNGTTFETSGNPVLDKWAPAVASTITTNAGAAAASITTIANGRATVTGLTGIVAADKGRFLVVTGASSAANNNWHQIEEILSSTSVRIDARQFTVVAPDANNGALIWSITDPSFEVFAPAATYATQVGWWVAQGPSVLKIPFTVASTGTFLRGEKITQASTGAEGELVGYTFYNGTGWLVVSPRLRGSGTGVHGWQTGNVITGAKSGATVSHNGTAIDYVYEVMFSKPANQSAIHIAAVQVDKAAESAELFSVTAVSASATVAPVLVGTHSWVIWGTTGTGVTGGSVIQGSPGDIATGHVICVDAIPEAGYSADGSWAAILARYEDSTTNGGTISDPVDGMSLYGLQRLNDTEDGEISIYTSVAPVASKTIDTRTGAGNITTLKFDQLAYISFAFDSSTTNHFFSSWRARGLTTEAFADHTIAVQRLTQTGAGTVLQQVNFLFFTRMLASANPFARPREKIWLTGITARSYKGSLKWLYFVNGGGLGDIFAGDPGWAQLSVGGSNSGLLSSVRGGGCVVIGPADATVPWLNNSFSAF